jgi:RHS repeat-associated protein
MDHFKVRVTLPSQFSTETTFWGRGAPSDARPSQIVCTLQPDPVYGSSPAILSPTAELQTTDIARNKYGDTVSITRSGSGPNGGVSAKRSFVYDPNDRLCARIEPESGTTIFDYDGAGNLAWSASGQSMLTCDRTSASAAAKTMRSYDNLSRLTAIDVPGSTNDPAFVYFPDGALQAVTNGTARWDYTYNKLRLPVTEKLTFGGKIRTLTHAYNALGHESSLTYPNGLVISSSPNSLGQPTQSGSFAGGVKYFSNGGMSGFTYGNGIIHTMVQNARQLPDRSLDQKPGQASVLDDSYDYDFNGNVVSITDGVSGGGGNRDMTYDGLDRLINTNAPNWVWLNAHTTYDALDNIRTNRVGTSDYTYTYDAAKNTLTAITDTVTRAPIRSIVTDARGNITANGAQALNFDYANRLATAVGKESYAYDGHGRRVWINRTSDNKASFPMYSLAGQLVTEDDYRSNLTTDYIYLSGSLVAKRYATIGTGAWTIRYIHTDALGTPTAETSTSAGSAVRIEKFTPFGMPNDKVFDQGPGFTGHVTDAATGLSYMQQRYYDPAIGRFLSVDPVTALDNGDMRHLNRFAYAYNSPYKFTDPDGRCPDACIVEVVIPAGVIYAGAGILIGAGICVAACEEIQESMASAVSSVADGVRGIFSQNESAETEGQGEGTPAGECVNCGGETTPKIGAIADATGATPKEVRGAMHPLKDNLPKSSEKKNPDVEVCTTCGEVYPQTSDGTLGDSIGNIHDHL